MARKKHVEHENHERWLVSYADFITLLFAFFVVLYAMSTRNLEKEKKLENTMKAQFAMSGGEGNFGGSGGIMGNLIDPLESLRNRQSSNAEVMDAVKRILLTTMSEEDQKESISKIDYDERGVRMTLNAEEFFPSGSPKLKMGALKSLDKIAQVLKLTNRDIVIEGHTDDQPFKGESIDSNWELAALRATSVVRYLVKIHQMNPTKISAVSFADQRPLVPNVDEESRAKNRRIEIVIVNSMEE